MPYNNKLIVLKVTQSYSSFLSIIISHLNQCNCVHTNNLLDYQYFKYIIISISWEHLKPYNCV